MIFEEELDMLERGLVRLPHQPAQGAGGSQRRHWLLWVQGLGVELGTSVGTGDVYGPSWLSMLEVHAGRGPGLPGNALRCAVARCARDPALAEALLSAQALGGLKAVQAILKHEEPPA